MQTLTTATVAQPAQLYLASASPRRVELLAQLGLRVHAVPQHVDESLHAGERPADYVVRVARLKAESALQGHDCGAGLPVLAADTAVVCDDMVLGKPRSCADAQAMLQRLSGRTHQVLTAVAVGDRQRIALALVSTDVTFRAISEAEIDAYWACGEPRDKAGAYAIQGYGAMFVSRIEGSYSGVVGLPLFESLQLLAEFSVSSTDLLRGSTA